MSAAPWLVWVNNIYSVKVAWLNSFYKVSVVDDYAAMLNQTNVGQNNNKFYVIQVLTNGSSYWSFNRWGRVGENGQQKTSAFGSNKNGAIADFEKK